VEMTSSTPATARTARTATTTPRSASMARPAVRSVIPIARPYPARPLFVAIAWSIRTMANFATDRLRRTRPSATTVKIASGPRRSSPR
jgi:hypothetical protein